MNDTATPTALTATATAAAVGALADNPVPLADRSDTIVAYWEGVVALGHANGYDDDVRDTLDDGEIESLFSSAVKASFREHLLPALDGSDKVQRIMLDLLEQRAKAALKGLDKQVRKTATDRAMVKAALENCVEDFIDLLQGMVDAAPAMCNTIVHGYTNSVTLPGGETGQSIIEKSITGVRATAAERRRTAAASINATR